MTQDPLSLPPELPIPEDDGAAAHLRGVAFPDVVLPSSAGPVALGELARGRLVLYAYPRTAPAEEPIPPGWDEVPGARGCTPQACGFRDHSDELSEFGAAVAGLSAQPLAEQRELAARLKMPFPIVSDPRFRLADELSLPTFEFAGRRFYRRLALIAEEGTIVKVFHPVFPPDRSAAEAVEWLNLNRRRPRPRRRREEAS